MLHIYSLTSPYFVSERKDTVGASFSASSCDTGGCHGVGDLDVNAGSGPTDPVPHTPLVEGGSLEPALSLPPSEVVTQTAPCPLPLPGPVLASGGVLTSLLTLLRPRHQHGVGSDVQVSTHIVLAPLPAVAVTGAVLPVVTRLDVGVVVVVRNDGYLRDPSCSRIDLKDCHVEICSFDSILLPGHQYC